MAWAGLVCAGLGQGGGGAAEVGAGMGVGVGWAGGAMTPTLTVLMTARLVPVSRSSSTLPGV